MKLDILKTRRGKLKHKILTELKQNAVNLENILNHVDEYEKDNLDSITKLRKERSYDAKKINGAIKNCINAHGPITKILIGSCTKRILGATIVNEKPKNKSLNLFRLSIEILGVIYIIYTLWK